MGLRRLAAVAFVLAVSSLAETGNVASYMLVIGGRYGFPDLLSLDPRRPLPECLAHLNMVPFAMSGGAGATLQDGTPLACWGVQEGDNDCYTWVTPMKFRSLRGRTNTLVRDG